LLTNLISIVLIISIEIKQEHAKLLAITKLFSLKNYAPKCIIAKTA
jgi:hypothetical protein